MKYTIRIKKNRTFRYIFKKGNFCKGKYIILHSCTTKYSSDKDKKYNFFAVCVSKKNGNSVQRNKLKRYAREVYKNVEKDLKLGYNIVVMYKKDTTCDNVDFHVIEEDITKCLRELDLYEENNI